MGLGQSNRTFSTKVYFIFDSWFASNSSSEAAMDVGADIVGMVKINTKSFIRAPSRI